ncbi:MAG TPA: M56 family metallopeptidase [Terriglobia bacterium]|nr:M56 family metallopeptidase [Terriglobia bacterium]
MTIPTLFESLGRFLLEWSLQLAVLAAVVALVLACDWRQRPELRHRILLLALVLSLILPIATHAIATFHWTAKVKAALAEPTPMANTTVLQGAQRIEVSGSPGIASMTTQSSRPAPERFYATLSTILGLLWCAGISISAFRRIRQYRKLAQVVRCAQRDPRLEQEAPAGAPAILLSKDVSSPLLYGWLRPVILLPQNILEWTAEAQRAEIVRHEHVHFARKDHWVSLLQGLVRTLFFFHPLVRWMCRQLEVERELVCDAEVLRQGFAPNSYAATLLLVAQHALTSEAGIRFANAANLSRRIECLFNPRKTPRVALWFAPFLFLAPPAALGFWQARVESIPQIGSLGLARFLPLVPEVPPLKPIALQPQPVRSRRLEASSAASQEPAPVVSQRFSSVTILRGQGDQEEVRIAVGIPYAELSFSPRTTMNGTAVLQASSRLESRISNLAGSVVARVDDPIQIEVPASMFRPEGMAVYQTSFQLLPGTYSLFVVASNANPGNAWRLQRQFEVPGRSASALSTSSLTLADLLEKPARPSRSYFAIDNFVVRPNLTGKYRMDQDLRIFQKVYSESVGTLLLDLSVTAGGKEFKRVSEELKSPDFTIAKTLSLSDFAPGRYEIQVTVTDPTTGQSAASTSSFTVE